MVDSADAATNATGQIEERSDLGKGDSGLWAFWLAQDKLAAKQEQQFLKDGREAIRRYRSERPDNSQMGRRRTRTRLNLFWSNLQLLRPAIYAREPKPDVQRRWRKKDDVGRLASMILERSMEYYHDACNFGAQLGLCVDDRLIQGRGVMRLLYIPHFAPDDTDSQGNEAAAVADTDDAAGEPSEQAQAEEVEGDEAQPPAPMPAYEEIRWIHVFWEDYREGPARTYQQVPWVRYRAYMNRDELRERFPDDADQINLDAVTKADEMDENAAGNAKSKAPPTIFEQAEIWEIWDRNKKEVVWLAPGTPNKILDLKPDPLRLPGFFPQPEPLQATTTTDRRTPVADYTILRDLYEEVDQLTARINTLLRAVAVRGVYAATDKSTIQQLLDDRTENKLIPVRDWAQFAGDRGGLEKLILWLPIDMVVKVVIELYNARDRAKDEISEMTGVGDVMRGMSDPRETSEAQSIKAGFGTLRMSQYQHAVQRFARECCQVEAAAIAEHVEPPVLSLITGLPDIRPVPQVGPPPQAPAPPLAPPMGANVVPMAPGAPPMAGPAPAGPQAAPGGPPGAPPMSFDDIPSPQEQQFQQALQNYQGQVAAAQAIEADNQRQMGMFQQAVQLIREQAVHAFAVDIETDSTIAIDEEQDREQRTAFLGQMIPLLENLIPIIQGKPPMVRLARELVMFAVRGFKIARGLEDVIEDAFDEIAGMPAADSGGKGSGPTPAELHLKGKEVDAKVAETNAKVQSTMIQAAAESQRSQAEIAEGQQRLKLEALDAAGKLQLAAQDQQADQEFKRDRATAMQTRAIRGLGS